MAIHRRFISRGYPESRYPQNLEIKSKALSLFRKLILRKQANYPPKAYEKLPIADARAPYVDDHPNASPSRFRDDWMFKRGHRRAKIGIQTEYGVFRQGRLRLLD